MIILFALKFKISMKIFSVLVFLFTSSCLPKSLQETCIVPDNSSKFPLQCKASTIDQFCKDTGGIPGNTVVTVLSGTHRLSMTCEVNNVNNITLRSQSDSKVIIRCSSLGDSGFRFLNVSTLNISGIEFNGCGATWTTQPLLDYLHLDILSALLFVNGSNLTLMNVLVSDAQCAGIYIYNVAGNTTLDSCYVNNASSNMLDTVSGNIIVYDRLTSRDTSFYVSSSQFINSGYKCMQESTNAFSYSSGLTLFLGSSKLSLYIVNTSLSQNTGCNGGNMAIVLFKFTSVTISQTKIDRGHSKFGGGVYVTFENSFLDYDSKTDHIYSHKVLNSTFADNCAENAGGGVFMHWKQSLLLNGSSAVNISSTNFTGNSIGFRGRGGLAFHYRTYFDTSDNSKSLPKFFVSFSLLNCRFFNHYLNSSSEELQPESSVILAANVPYLGIYGITVESNCTAILAIGSTLVFYGSTRISNNTALTGAGLRLCSGATIYLTPHTSLTITNNFAQQTGGGIQVYSNCLTSLPMCFYQYSRVITRNSSLLSTVNFTVRNNRAPNGGYNIYGGSMDYCYLIYVRTSDKRYRRPLHVPYNNFSLPSSISSDPRKICFTYFKVKFECNKTSTVSIYPGQKVKTPPIRGVGQYSGSVSGTVLASTIGGAAIEDYERVQTVGISGRSITHTIYSSKAYNFISDEVSINLTVSTHEYSHHNQPAAVHIDFKECPFGFVNTNIGSSELPQ